MRTISNERGGMAALLTVIVLSTIMVTTLTSFYIYLENRAKFQQRIRMNYQMGYIMEDMGKAVGQARQAFIAGNGTCPAGTVARFLDCTAVCMSPTPTGADNSFSHSVCVKNTNLNKITKGADYFCAFNTDGGASMPAYCTSVADTWEPQESTMVAVHESDNTRSDLKNWYSRLDRFFDSTVVQNVPVVANKMYPFLEAELRAPHLFDWLLPQKAFAQDDYPPGRPPTNPGGSQGVCTDPTGASCVDQCNSNNPPENCPNSKVRTVIGNVGGSSGCSATSTDERCKRCNGHDRILGGCLKISICPPWLSNEECGEERADKRIHQMVKVDLPTMALSPPPPPPPPPPGAPADYGSCLDECDAYGGGPLCNATSVPGGCMVDCSGRPTIWYRCR